MLYLGWFFKMLKAHTNVFGFTDICQHFQLFVMCVSQDIVKVSLDQILFNLKCF